LLVAQAGAAKNSLTKQEKYVLKQVAVGKVADLKAQFGEEEENRILSASFLKDLLAGNYNVHRKGIWIVGAVIPEQLDLEFFHITEVVRLSNCRFKKHFVCRDAVFDKNFAINDSEFEKGADFSRVYIKRHFACKSAKFTGYVDFSDATIGGIFLAEGAIFKGPADFNCLDVGQDAIFTDIIFHPTMEFIQANIDGQFYLRGAAGEKKKGAKILAELILTGTIVQRILCLERFNLSSLNSRHLQVKGPAIFEDLTITESANFQNAKIEVLRFIKANFPEDKPKAKTELKLDGLTYTSILVKDPNKPNGFQALLGLVSRASFNPQNYLELESFCKRSGHAVWADDVYIAMKDRDLAQLDWWNPSRWLVWFFWGVLAGYGRAPLRVIWLGLAIVFLGAVLFNPRHMEGDRMPPDGKKLRRLLLRILISLDQFLPAVNMRLAEHWKAKENPYPIWLYFTVERVLGWILIPIALAAIYTQIK
jgi:hypothetical protein